VTFPLVEEAYESRINTNYSNHRCWFEDLQLRYEKFKNKFKK